MIGAIPESAEPRNGKETFNVPSTGVGPEHPSAPARRERASVERVAGSAVIVPAPRSESSGEASPDARDLRPTPARACSVRSGSVGSSTVSDSTPAAGSSRVPHQACASSSSTTSGAASGVRRQMPRNVPTTLDHHDASDASDGRPNREPDDMAQAVARCDRVTVEGDRGERSCRHHQRQGGRSRVAGQRQADAHADRSESSRGRDDAPRVSSLETTNSTSFHPASLQVGDSPASMAECKGDAIATSPSTTKT